MIPASDDPGGRIAAFVREVGFDPDDIVDCTQFALDPPTQDELAALVVARTKRATTSLRRWYTDGAERMPEPGDLFVVLDSRRVPQCVCRTTAVEIRRFDEVDAEFAHDEGEDDRSLASWRRIHQRFFSAEAAAHGFSFTGESLVVLSRFEVTVPT